eukprot:653793-Amorphochlora_amoeboformis.AAC.1
MYSAGYGADVDLLIRRDSILRGFDTDCGDYLRDAMIQQGVNIRKQTEAVKIEKRGDRDFLVHLSTGDVIEADVILCAIGRNPKVLTQKMKVNLRHCHGTLIQNKAVGALH